MTITMAKLLKELDLEEFDDPFGGKPAFRMRFGQHEIQLVPRTNRHLQRVYAVGGIINTGRAIASIETELPIEVATRQEGLALVGYFVGRHIPDELKPDWLKRAERLHHHLPWNKDDPQKSALNSSGPLVRQEHPRVSISIDLDVKEDGSVEISGQDLGQAPEAFVGRDSYEYWMRLKPAALPSLAGALLRDKYDGNASAVLAFRDFCEEHEIPHEYGSW